MAESGKHDEQGHVKGVNEKVLYITAGKTDFFVEVAQKDQQRQHGFAIVDFVISHFLHDISIS